jgi:geranylgeranyl reductase family protein
MEFDEEINVLIAGAGPAGAATSLFLCKHKIPHTIIDKAVFPRDKICGDALSGKVFDVLRRYDKNIVNEINSDISHFLGSYGVKFASPNGNYVDIPFKTTVPPSTNRAIKNPISERVTSAPGFLARRMEFDNFLFQKIDRSIADVWENYSIKELKKTSNGIECVLEQNGKQTKVLTKLIVGAEGDRSLVARHLAGFRKEDKYYCAGLRAYFKGVKNFHEQNFIELHFIKELLPGYLWIFPLPNGEANVGVGMLSEAVSRKKINLKKVMIEAIRYNPTIKDKFLNAEMMGEIKGWGLPLGSKKRKISGNNFLLTGDAASLIDPFTGEGIGNAMTSGMIAAKHIELALQNNRFDDKFLSAYDKEVYDILWNELSISATLQRFSKYGKLFNYVVNKASTNETFRNTLSCMFDDLSLREKLKDPKVYFRLLFKR